MNINNWVIFDKSGSPINWFADNRLPLSFSSALGKNAAGYLITNISGHIYDSKITNSGFNYNTNTNVYFTDVYTNTIKDITLDVSLNYLDVSIFNPSPSNVKGVRSLSNIDISTLYEYPSSVYSSTIFLKPVSQGIVETEHLFILENIDGSLYRPFDSSISTLVVELVGEDDVIKLFTVDENQNIINWTDSLTFDLSYNIIDTPITLNIGFKSSTTGVYERSLRFYSLHNDIYYTLGEIIVNAESFGEDERFRTLLGNFGLPDPKNFPKLFKESNINEDLVDYGLINTKSKQMILDHHEIIPYIGTYKALVNAIKWLGYDDIYIREWFKNVKENKLLSLYIPYNSTDRAQTLLKFSPDERKVLKKLNQLSLNYSINSETGNYDKWGTPETVNTYSYNLNEVFVKLSSLKIWLEENIIGINSKIIDITGEGIYFETFINQVYSTDNIRYNYKQAQRLSPISIPTNTELIKGDSSINLTLLEYSQLKISDLNNTFNDHIDYIWDPLNPNVSLSSIDPSYLQYPNNYLAVGSLLSTPFTSLSDIQWKLSVEKPLSGVISDPSILSKPLWIYDNTIKFYDILDTSTIFYDNSTNLSIFLEKAYIKDPSCEIWNDSTMYTIYTNSNITIPEYSFYTISRDGNYSILNGSGEIRMNDDIISYNVNINNPFELNLTTDISIFTTSETIIYSPYLLEYIMESSIGEIYKFDNNIYFQPSANSLFQYAIDRVYNLPLFHMKNFITYDTNDVSINLLKNKTYYLDIIDGKIFMDGNFNNTQYHTIKFNFDASLYKQFINLNVEYLSPRLPLSIIDPSIYYWADPSGLSGGTNTNYIIEDNSIVNIKVNHIGDYKIEVFGFDDFNNAYNTRALKDHNVWVKKPNIYTLIDNSINISILYPQQNYISLLDISTLISENKNPIYDRQFSLQGITLETDKDSIPYIKIPYINQFENIPKSGDIFNFYNLTEHIVDISTGNKLIIDPDYQSFFNGDSVSMVLFNKSNYLPLEEIDASIIAKSGNILTMNNIPSNFKIDSSYGIYLLNNTLRSTSNYVFNADNSTFTIDISMFGNSYINNQLINFIIVDNSTNYSWGASYRIIKEPIGSKHTFRYGIPHDITNNLNRFSIYAKHAFSTFVNFTEKVKSARRFNNNLEIYLENNYSQYFLDNTFVSVNTLFNQEYSNDQWYDASLNLITSDFYYYNAPIDISINNLCILQANYDVSLYLLNQKNIWNIRKNKSNETVLKVHNNIVPFVFDVSGYYDIEVDTFDKYGNLSNKIYEGLIHIK